MPLLIGLLFFFGCFALGSFMGEGAVTVIALVFTAPGFLYEKVFPQKNVSKGTMFLVDLAFWSAVFGILHLCSKLTVLNVTLGIVVSLVIGIIAAFFYFFFGFDSRKKTNCKRCGKVVSYSWGIYKRFCRKCEREEKTLIKREIQKQAKTKACYDCSGTGRNKAYKCARCNGRGSIPRSPDEISSAAWQSLIQSNPEWKAYYS